MIRAHKIRLHPTPAQAIYFRKAAGTARFVYNWALARWRQHKTEYPGEAYGVMALKREFNAIKHTQFPWVFEVTKSVCEGAFTNLGKAFTNYYNCKDGKYKGAPVGFPGFKSKKRGTQSFGLANDRFEVNGHWIRIPKLGRVNMAEPLRFAGKIMGAVVSCTAEKWYASIWVEVEKPMPVLFAEASVGVDVGVKTLATLSDGRQYENQALLRRELNKLRHLSRPLSRRQQGSQRW